MAAESSRLYEEEVKSTQRASKPRIVRHALGVNWVGATFYSAGTWRTKSVKGRCTLSTSTWGWKYTLPWGAGALKFIVGCTTPLQCWVAEDHDTFPNTRSLPLDCRGKQRRIEIHRLSHSEARPAPLLITSGNFSLSHHLSVLINGRSKDEGRIRNVREE